MLVFFLMSLILGAAGYAGFLLLKSPVAAGSPSLRDPGVLKRPDSSPSLPADPRDEKIAKMDVLLAEKNRELSALQEALKNEQAHRDEFETLKGILQHQIEDLKGQNKQLREDLAKTAKDALAAQEKTVRKEAAPVVSVNPPKTDSFEAFFNASQKEQGGGPSLSLHDIFEQKKDKPNG